MRASRCVRAREMWHARAWEAYVRIPPRTRVCACPMQVCLRRHVSGRVRVRRTRARTWVGAWLGYLRVRVSARTLPW